MRYLSVCSGIEAATVAWHPLGWEPVAFSEIEPFPSAVLAYYYPAVPNLGDMETFRDWSISDVDLLVGGTPCQSFSVAGLRKGMDDPRGNLALVYLAMADRFRPEWLVWENVPGVLSSNGGRDFGAFLGALGELGYGFAYRVLDAQYFGLAQRRKRVFVVANSRGWQRAAAVLFEPESLRGDPAPRREAGTRTAGTLTRRALDGSSACGGDGRDGLMIASTGDVSHCLNAGGMGRQDYEPETLIAQCVADPLTANEANTYCHGGNNPRPRNLVACFDETQITHPENRSCNQIEETYVPEIAPCLESGNNRTGGTRPPGTTVDTAESLVACFDETQITSRENRSIARPDSAALQASARPPAIALQVVGKRTGCSTDDPRAGIGISAAGDPMFTLQAGAQHGVSIGAAVRRLTPRECERLQGFPDDYTLIRHRGKPASDSARYRALGNSMAVPVMAWIGRRIQAVRDLDEMAA